jgi:endonuclease YncB( thermonuclease family)
MLILMRILSIIAFVLLMTSQALAAETFPARVVGVVDGDTLRVSRKEGGTIELRLYGIDCPETGQFHIRFQSALRASFTRSNSSLDLLSIARVHEFI